MGQLVDLITELSYHLQCFVLIPNGSTFHHSLAVDPGTLVMASPETPSAPSGTVIWLMSTIGSQLGTVLASNIQNGISCPMLESWRNSGELALRFLHGIPYQKSRKFHENSLIWQFHEISIAWIPTKIHFVWCQGDGSHPSCLVAEHCRQNADRRPR